MRGISLAGRTVAIGRAERQTSGDTDALPRFRKHSPSESRLQAVHGARNADHRYQYLAPQHPHPRAAAGRRLHRPGDRLVESAAGALLSVAGTDRRRSAPPVRFPGERRLHRRGSDEHLRLEPRVRQPLGHRFLSSEMAARRHGGGGHTSLSRLSRFRAGDLVEVRSEAEILGTLDERGMLEGMPFMPEMLQYCGRQFRVGQVAHKTCDTIHYSGIRRVSAAVHLADLRCDGSAHGGCDADCLFFWKDAWLKPAGEKAGGSSAAGGAKARGRTVDELLKHTRQPDGERYVCQVTELL